MKITPNSKQLLVEGRDEEYVIKSLLARYNLQPPFEIKPKEGIDNLRRSIYAEINAPGRSTLGILADANDSPANRWKSISGRLTEADCKVPLNLSKSGSIFPGPQSTTVGVWLMPGNHRRGELEDFVADMIPEGDTTWPRAKLYVDGIPKEERKFAGSKRTRAYVHSWLATREDPRAMGTAITSGDLLHDAPIAASFVEWLRKLFGF